MKNKKRLIGIISVLVLLVTLMGFGWSYFTDYKIRQLRADGGVSLTLEKDKGISNVTQEGYKVSKNGVGWYKKGTSSTINSSVKTGYTFDGWYNGGTKVATTQKHTFIISEPTILTAKTKTVSYAINTNLDGGTIDGKTTWSKQYTVEDTVTLPTPIKTGYTFLGWVEDGGLQVPNKNVVIPVGTTGDKTYTAKWQANSYRIDINATLDNGVTQPNATGMGKFDVYVNDKIYYRDATDMAENLPYGTVIEIKNIKADEGKTYVGSDLPLRMTLTEKGLRQNLKFKTNEYTLRYNVNGGSGTIPDVKFKHGASVTTASSGFTKEFYHLSKWNTIADGTGTNVAIGGKYSGYSGKDGDIVNLYAQYDKNILTVVYYANGGTGYEHQSGDKLGYTTVPYDSDLFAKAGLASFTNSGTFEKCKKLYFHPTEMYHIGSGTSSNLISSLKPYPLAKDLASDLGLLDQLKKGNVSVDLYAEWARNVLTINYHSNNATTVFDGALNSSGIGEGKDVIVATQDINVADENAHLTNYFATNDVYYMKRIGHTGLGTYSNSPKGTVSVGQDEIFSNYAELVKALGGNVDYNNGTINVYPQWRPNRVNIRYHVNGGTMLSNASTRYKVNSLGYITKDGSMDFSYGDYNDTLKGTNTGGDLFDPTVAGSISLGKTGYNISARTGWSTNSSGTGKVFDSTVTLKGQDITNLDNGDATVTLYANWKPNTYTVKYNANGGLGTMEDSSHVYDIAKSLNANTFTRTGYTFRGWTTNADGTGDAYNNCEYLKNLTSENGGIVNLYAQWNKIGYVIQYDLQGGSVNGNPISYDVTSPDITLRNPTKVGYTFIGWTGSNGATPQTTVVIKQGTTGNLSYTANWKVNNYTLTFDANGGTCTEKSRSVAYGSKYGTLPTPTRSGYTFKGWFTTANGTIKVTEANIMGTSNVTVYAQWTPNSYTYNIAYKSTSGVSLGTSTVKGTFGSTVTVNPPSKTGYTSPASQNVVFDSVTAKTVTFVYTPINYTISYEYYGGSVATANKTSYNIETASFTLTQPTKTGHTFNGYTGTDLSTSTKVVTIPKGSTGNRSYTARWTINQYTVRFLIDDDFGSRVETRTYTYGQLFGTLPTVIRTGYTFLGWFTEPNGGYQISSSDRVTKSADYYQCINPNHYTVRYHPNGGVGSIIDDDFTYSFGGSALRNPYTYSGHHFVGWNTKEDGTGVSYKENDYLYNLTGEPDGVVDLYAQWELDEVIVVFEDEFGQAVTKKYSAGQTLGSLPTPQSKVGYTFKGWYTDRSFSTRVYENTVVDTNTTYYARWDAITYFLDYYDNFPTGENKIYTLGTLYDKSVVIENPHRVPSGYEFVEWNTRQDGLGTSFYVGQTVSNLMSTQSSHFKLYAQWRQKTHATVRLNVTGYLNARYQWYINGEYQSTLLSPGDSIQVKIGDTIGIYVETHSQYKVKDVTYTGGLKDAYVQPGVSGGINGVITDDVELNFFTQYSSWDEGIDGPNAGVKNTESSTVEEQVETSSPSDEKGVVE